MAGTDDALLAAFAAGSRARLAGIARDKALLLSGEADAGSVGRLLRAVHCIAESAAFLGLDSLRDLGRGLRQALCAVRDGRVGPDREAAGPLARGFDILAAALQALPEAWQGDMAEAAGRLTGLLDTPDRAAAGQFVAVACGQGLDPFSVDALRLAEALGRGNRLYCLTFDLLADIQRQGRTPLDVLAALAESGLILDCRLGFEAAGDLAAGPGRSLPLAVLYATIIDAEIAGLLFGLAQDRIRPVEGTELLCACDEGVAAEQSGSADCGGAGCACADCAGYAVEQGEGRAVLRLTERETVERMAGLKTALLACFAGAQEILLDASALREADITFFQLVSAAGKTAQAQGKSFGLLGPLAPEVRARLLLLGISPPRELEREEG